MSEITPYNFTKKTNRKHSLSLLRSFSFHPSLFINKEEKTNLHVYQVLVDNDELQGISYVIHRYIDDGDHHLLFVVEFYLKTK